MKITNKVYYYTLEEAINEGLLPETPVSITPFATQDLNTFITTTMGLTLPAFKVNLTDSHVEELWQDMLASKYKYFIFAIKKCFYDNLLPSASEVSAELTKWVYKLLAMIEHTYPYYSELLTAYDNAKTHLMEDIRTTSDNSIKFNDTPQNPNSSGVYEGDDYITNYTKTHGETTSPLMTKMLRLKEIQDNFKRVMEDWVSEVGRIFLPEGDL